MRLLLLLFLIASLGACTVPRAISLEAALHEPEILPRGVHRTNTAMDPTLFYWDSAKVPAIYVEVEWHGELSDLITWYDRHLPKQGWHATWKSQTQPDGEAATRMEGTYERARLLVKETLHLDAYPMPGVPDVCMLKVTLYRDSVVDKPSRAIGLEINQVFFGWMGESEVFFEPIEGALFCIF